MLSFEVFDKSYIGVGAVAQCSCTHRFSDGLILNPQILREDDFYAPDFHDFLLEVTLLISFWEHF